MNEPKEISMVLVGDIHAGSRSAICVPEMEMEGGGHFRHSAAQAGLYDAWCSLAKEWAKPDILIVNGDAIEGQARKESGAPCWSTDLDDQIECARRLIEMFKGNKTYIIEGTGYHTDAGGKSLEHHLGERLNSEKIGSGNSNRAATELFLNVGGITIHAAHHVSIGTGWYKTTPLARELVFALLNESDFHKVDLIVRSHVHYFCGVEFHRQRGYTLPCWQLRTKYMMKKSAFGMTPSIGALRFKIRGNSIHLEKRFFKPVECKPKLFRYEESD